MIFHKFAAYTLPAELDLTKLGSRLGIMRKYRWEEPMQLNPVTLQAGDSLEDRHVYLYSFGSVVFRNCTDADVESFAARMTAISEIFGGFPNQGFQEHYSLRIESGNPVAITNDYAIVSRYDNAFIDIIAFVVAKSVALERIEEQVDTVLDETEDLIALLDRGELTIPDRRLAGLASKVLNFRYRSIACIMVLEKPDITWDNPEADRFYLTLANLFELGQRYHQIKHKSETLMAVTEVFTGLSHARRSTRLEWIIIALIFIEIVIYLFQILHWLPAGS